MRRKTRLLTRLVRTLAPLLLDVLYLTIGAGLAIAARAYFGAYVFADMHGANPPADWFRDYTITRTEGRTILLAALYLLASLLGRLGQSWSKGERQRPTLWGMQLLLFAFVCSLGWLPVRLGQAAGLVYPPLAGCCETEPPGQTSAELVEISLSLFLTALFPVLVYASLRRPKRSRRRY